ncbi:MAG: MotA/TolQ/ExbB proton channel family protein, partial [Clostridiales bacterium]|nr:MotA/TolQ/ExbB proton channel family protein [Clostridiales bacterium]
SYIVNNFVEASVYLAMALIFIAAWARCLLPMSRTGRRLARATRQLKRGADKNAWQDRGFLGKGALHGPWNEYLNNRLFADEDYHSASDVEDYVNENTAIDRVSMPHFSEAAPGLFVSLGFLGTLMGIMIGLNQFSMDSSTAVMSTISVLIGGMRYAFMTSIVGVVLSISYTILSRIVRSGAVRSLSAFYDALRAASGKAAVDPINQMAIYQQEQTALLQTIAEDMTTGMMDRMGSMLEMALEPLRSTMTDFVTASTREQLKGIDLIVNRFITRLNDVMEGQFENLSKTIAETSRWQKETREAVGITMERLGRVSGDILQIEQLSESLIVKFDGYMTKLGSAQLQIDDGYASVSANVKNMELVARQQASYLAQVGQLHADFRKDILSFETAMEAFMKATVDNTNISTGALRKTSEELKHNAELLADANRKFLAGINDELKRTMDLFDDNMAGITGQLGEVVAEVREAVDGVPPAIAGAREVIDALPAVFVAGGRQYAANLAELSAAMSQATAAFERAAADLAQRIAIGNAVGNVAGDERAGETNDADARPDDEDGQS